MRLIYPTAVDENVVHTSKAESTSVGVQNNSTELGVGVDRTTNEALSYPKASYYCLTGVAGCFTDFHVDFGGSSVWYTVLKGVSQLLELSFIDFLEARRSSSPFRRPRRTWPSLNSGRPARTKVRARRVINILFSLILIEFTFFGDLAGPVMKIVVKPGQTLLLPSGWIHAVYTPYDR